MSPTLVVVLEASFIGLFVCIVVRQIRHRESSRILPSAFVVCCGLLVVFLAKPAIDETKGPADETLGVIFCYGAMLLGMCAEYGYRQAERGPRHRKFELMQFMMPIFASPIVFIPLLTITTDLSIGGAFTNSKLMVYLVAFQNGFFWKTFFEDRRQHALDSVPNAPDATNRKPRPLSLAAGR